MNSEERAHHKLIKWIMQRWFRLSRSMTLGVRAAIFNEAGEIYLIRHTYVPGWHMPGGGVEKGQTLLEALKDECAQEAGVTLTGAPSLFAVYSNHHSFPNDHVALYIVKVFEKREHVSGTREIAEGGFFALDTLPEGTTEATRQRLLELSGAAPISPYWKEA